MKSPPHPRNIRSFIQSLSQIQGLAFSEGLVERISSSGDAAGTPFYHWRWKKKCLADVVVWPNTPEQISALFKRANQYSIPVTPRGAGSCYYGSAVPALGGVVLDVKRMRAVAIDEDGQTACVQAGTCFSRLMEELDRAGFQLGAYPTSALTATLGGWAANGGSVGIGTCQNGSFFDQVLQIQVVVPSGEIINCTQKEDIEKFFGTQGILGVITEFTLKIYPKQVITPFFFGFGSIASVTEAVNQLLAENPPFFVRFSDEQYEIRSSGLNLHPFYLFVVLNEPPETTVAGGLQVMDIAVKNGGVYLGNDISRQLWAGILLFEMKAKLATPVFMVQQLNVNLPQCLPVIQLFEQLTAERALNHAFYGIANNDQRVRLTFYTPTDNADWGHFLASKGVLHRVVKEAYKRGGRVYTYGLQNAIYLLHFKPQLRKTLLGIKQRADPNYLLNPLKLIESKISFAHIDVMFELALFWRRLAAKVGRAQRILAIETPQSLSNIAINDAEGTRQ